MKKIFFATAAAIMMFSACETLVSHEGETSSDVNSEKVVLTATVGNDTKTYLEQVSNTKFKTRWAEDDDFIVIDRDVDFSSFSSSYDFENYVGYFELESGAGESQAQFVLEEGVLPDRYYAFYGEVEPIDGTSDFSVWLSRWQNRELRQLKDGQTIQTFEDWVYPMFATGNGTDLHFQNMCSVLKISVTGKGEELQYVKVETKDDGVYLAGNPRIALSSSRPTLEFLTGEIGDFEFYSYNHIYYETSLYDNQTGQDIPSILSDEPIECYVVIPAQRYPSGLKITVITNEGMMEVATSANLTFAASELREIPTFEYEPDVSYDNCWTFVSDESPEPAMLTEEENGYLVLKNHFIDEYAYIYLYDENNNEYGWTTDYGSYRQLTNTAGQLQMDGHYIEIRQEGYYDIYLNPYTLQLFIMSAGVSISELPTTDNVAGRTYGDLYEGMNSEDLVKVYGRVAAISQRGFVMQLDLWDQTIFVYTYDSQNLSDDMKSMLSNLEVGNTVELYAINTTYYTGLPQLSDVRWCRVYDEDYNESLSPSDITDYDDVFYSDYTTAIRYVGVLNISGTYYNVTIDGNSYFKGSIYWPLEDLTQYNGKKVVVEGYYIGTSGSTTKYVNTVVTRIAVPDINGSTEDVIPDDDLVGTEINQTK